MTTPEKNTQIENYLGTIERVLQPFSVSDRAEIVLELKSHILAALERDPKNTVASVLASLGAPETVANRYLLERGLKPAKPPISPIVKWIAIGTMGTIALFLAFAGSMTFWLTRHINLDQLGDRTFNFSMSSSAISGTKSFDYENPSIVVKFTNGNFSFVTSADKSLHWDCKGVSLMNSSSGGSSSAASSLLTEKDGVSTLDFTKGSGVKCEVAVPRGAALSLDGLNGKIMLEAPVYSVKAQIVNAKINVRPARGVTYRYAISVQNGKLDSFESSRDPKAIPIELKLVNGKVSKSSESLESEDDSKESSDSHSK